MPLTQYNFIFALGTIFAFLDAWNIGANDVANSFATSVSSRSLTLKQAMIIASIMEFTGAIAVGNGVADTIRTKIIDPKLFDGRPEVLMLGMLCAVVSSSIYLTFATRFGLPVSTTHSIMGGVIGIGFATVGADRISWGWNGVSQVFAAWLIAPGIAGIFAATVFLITKYLVMKSQRPARRALSSIPFYFFLASSLITMLIVWKGAESKVHLSGGATAGVIVGVGGAVAVIIAVFLLPFAHRKVVARDWQLQRWHVLWGPLLLKRGPVPTPPPGKESAGIPNYYPGHMTTEELMAQRRAEASAEETHYRTDDEPGHGRDIEKHDTRTSSDAPIPDTDSTAASDAPPPRPDGKWYSPSVLFWYGKRFVLRGVEQDVVSAQKKKDLLSGDLQETHSRATRFDNDAEYMYSFLQILTAAAASFTHGANDVSNAVGPYATIYLIWHTGTTASKTPVPTWILAFGGIAIVLGLWLYGYHIMRNLGNRLTLMSPARGFCMELGSAITIIFATKLKLPVSTTQCITGAIVGVGLCNGDWRAINWRMVAWIYFGWLITLPVTAIISGCLMGIIINSPRW